MIKGRIFNVRLFAMLFASLVLGIAFSLNLIAGIVFFFILLAITLLMWLRPRKILLIVSVLVMYLLGFLYSFSLIHVTNNLPSYMEESYITAKISEDSNHNLEGVAEGRLILDDIIVSGQKVQGKATIYLKTDEHILYIGDKIAFYGTCEALPLEIGNLGDSSRYINGIRYRSTCAKIYSIKHGRCSFRSHVVDGSRDMLFNNVDENTAGFLQGMMFGDTGMLDGSVKVTSQRLGIAHLFAVSGLHVSIIAGFLVGILALCKVSRRYQLLVVPILIFYAYLCDFQVSILRATIMLTIYLVSRAFYLRYDMLSSLSLAGTILLLVCPLYLFDVSFVMSFLAVLSIALFASNLTKLFTKKSDKHMAFKTLLATNLSVNIGLLPIMLYLFGGISIITVPVNIVMIPLISLIFPFFFALYILVAICKIGTLVTIIAFPFRLIVLVSTLLSNVNFIGVYFDVSWYFVVTYVVVMILISQYVFLPKGVKVVPITLFSLMLLVSLVAPTIVDAVRGDKFYAESSYSKYFTLSEDSKGRGVLCIMGKVDDYIIQNALDEANKKFDGSVTTIVVPYLSDEEAELIADYNDLLGAKFLITKSVVECKGLKRAEMLQDIAITKSDNVLISSHDVTTLLLHPHNSKVDVPLYDVLIANNERVDDVQFSDNPYINFAKHSQGVRCSDFTFYIKNGKILMHN